MDYIKGGVKYLFIFSIFTIIFLMDDYDFETDSAIFAIEGHILLDKEICLDALHSWTNS
jgi:hypothetical protein